MFMDSLEQWSSIIACDMLVSSIPEHDKYLIFRDRLVCGSLARVMENSP